MIQIAYVALKLGQKAADGTNANCNIKVCEDSRDVCDSDLV